MQGEVRHDLPRDRPWPVRLIVLGLALTAVLLAGVWWVTSRGQQPAPPPPVEVTASPPAAPPASAAVDEMRLPAPVEAIVEPAPPPQPIDPADIESVLIQWLGRPVVLSMLQTGDFARRVAATVDNLARDYAAASLWPVNPSPGRFKVLERDGRTFIDPDNGDRYSPLVRMLTGIDAKRAAEVYVGLLPQLQRAYEELGFPDARFHTRLIAVIDHLLQAPVQTGLIEVTRVDVQGPIPSERPWLRYEYVDPALEQASAGRKMLWRMGPVNHRLLRAKLVAFRQALVGQSGPR